MIAKIIAQGSNRDEALARLNRGLSQTTVLVRGGHHEQVVPPRSPRTHRRCAPARSTRRGSTGSPRPTGTCRPRLADVALVRRGARCRVSLQAALDRDAFLELGQSRAAQAETEIGREVELRHGGQSYRVAVRRVGPTRYEVEARRHDLRRGRRADGSGLASRLTIGGRSFNVMSSTQGSDHLVEVDGVAHRFSRDDAGIVRGPGDGAGRGRRCRPGRHRGDGRRAGGRRGDEDGDRDHCPGERPSARRLRRPQRAGRRRCAVVPDRTGRRRRRADAREQTASTLTRAAGGPNRRRRARSGPCLRARLRRHDLRRAPPVDDAEFGLPTRWRSSTPSLTSVPSPPNDATRTPTATRPVDRGSTSTPTCDRSTSSTRACRLVQRPAAARARPLRGRRASIRPQHSTTHCCASSSRSNGGAEQLPIVVALLEEPAWPRRAARDARPADRVDPAASPHDRQPRPRGPVQPLRPVRSSIERAARSRADDEAARRRAPRIDRPVDPSRSISSSPARCPSGRSSPRRACSRIRVRPVRSWRC